MGLNNDTGERESSRYSGYIHFPCPVCNNKDLNNFHVLYPDTLRGKLPRFDYDFSPEHFKTYRIIVCKKCSHRYASPRPLKLWENYRDTEDIKYLKQKEDNMLTAQKVIDRLQRFSKGGRLLDVGCSTGDFLTVAKNYYDVEGLELSDWASGIAEERNLKIHSSNLNVLSSGNYEAYDIITLWAVIEHFEFPEKELKNISKLLKKGGLVCLWTGNAHSILAKIMGRKWWYIQAQHLQLFTKSSLIRLFNNNGFKLVWSGYYPKEMSMKSIGNSLGRYKMINKMAKVVLNNSFIANRSLTLKLPGELFIIFRKKR